jgi:hypothetical protein
MMMATLRSLRRLPGSYSRPLQCGLFSTSEDPVGRNKALAAVIRDGLGFLNQTALYIQEAKVTKRPLFAVHRESPDARTLAEEHRILSTANDCLDDLVQKGDGSFTIQGDPIVLLAIRVKPSLKQAIIYWALPPSILLDEEFTQEQKDYLVFRMEGIMEKSAYKLQQRVSSVLSSYFPPKVRFEPATTEMLMEFMD